MNYKQHIYLFLDFIRLKMEKGWNVLFISHGEITVRFLDGELLVIRADGRNGISFVREYLNLMNKHFKGQLMASNEILRSVLGKKYSYIQKIPNVLHSYIAITSLSCAFGSIGDNPHCDSEGKLHFTYAHCPLRPVCPFNGFQNKSNKKGPFGCNPTYETNLTPKMVEVARLLVESPKELSEIAEVLNLTEGRIRNIASEIYKAMKVKNRLDLKLLLEGKRII